MDPLVRLVYLPGLCYRVQYPTHEDTSGRGTLVRAVVPGMVNGSSSSVFRLMSTYQHQPVGTRVRPGVLDDISIGHPRAHCAEWKQYLRNLDDGEHVRMGTEISPLAQTTVYLAWGVLSTSLIKQDGHALSRVPPTESDPVAGSP